MNHRYAGLCSFTQLPQSRRRFSKSQGGSQPGRMGPDGVVKRLDVGEKVGLGGPAGIETAQVNQLAFRVAAGKKVFRHSVVVVGVALRDMRLRMLGNPDAHGRPRRRYRTPGRWKKISSGAGRSRRTAMFRGVQGELGCQCAGKRHTHNFHRICTGLDNGEYSQAFPGGCRMSPAGLKLGWLKVNWRWSRFGAMTVVAGVSGGL